MPRLPYDPEDFAPYMGSALTAPAQIVFSWAELCRAAVTVGRRNWTDVLQFGTYSVLETLWRLAMIRANLVEAPNGELRQSNAFVALDRSEKGAVSFFMGLVLTKLIAEKLFQVPWLLHLDVYRQQLAPQLVLPVRPDFVGMDASGLWIVIESKGRSWGLPNGLLDRAKRQARSIRSIAGQSPVLRVAVGTYFSGCGLRATVRDPDDPDPAAVDLESNQEIHARAYYRPIVELLDTSGSQHSRSETPNGTYITTPLSGMDATLAVDERILQWYHRGEPHLSRLLEERSSRGSVLRDLDVLRRLPERERASKISRDPVAA